MSTKNQIKGFEILFIISISLRLCKIITLYINTKTDIPKH